MHLRQVELDADEQAPRRARHLLAAWLDDVACSDDVQLDLMIITDELVTAAVNHGSRRLSLDVTYDDGRLRLDIRGQRSSTPYAGPIDDAAVARLVGAASDLWGYDTSGT